MKNALVTRVRCSYSDPGSRPVPLQLAAKRFDMIASCSRRAWMTAAVAALLASAVWIAADARAQDPPAPAAGDAEALYLDSRTGAVTAAPPPGGGLRLRPSEVRMLSMSEEGLLVRRSAGNGISVNLGGRFHHMATATLSRDGELSVGCATPRSVEGASAR